MDEVKSKLSNRMMIMIISVLIGLLAAGGLWWWIRAGRIVSTDDARVKGTIVAVSAKISGRVEKVAVNEGDNVQVGQVIAILEKQEIQAQVEEASANLAMMKAKLAAVIAGNRHQEVATANATVSQAMANLSNAQKNYERSAMLYKQGAIASQQLDAVKTATDVAEAQYVSAKEQYSLSAEGSRPEDIQMAQAQVGQAQAALTMLELQLANTTVKAPVTGVVALKSVENGEVVAAGQQLFNITDLADVWVNANIEETYIGRIKVGQPVEFTIDAFPGNQFVGHVMEVGSAMGSQFALLSTENSSSNFTKVTQRLPIKIKADDSDYILKPGMSAVVNIVTK